MPLISFTHNPSSHLLSGCHFSLVFFELFIEYPKIFYGFNRGKLSVFIFNLLSDQGIYIRVAAEFLGILENNAVISSKFGEFLFIKCYQSDKIFLSITINHCLTNVAAGF